MENCPQKLNFVYICLIYQYVVDNEESILLMLTMALAKFGFNVEIAADGLEGIKKFDEGRFDLVVTDILMPDLNGNDVARHIRNSEKKYTPVIAISGTPWLVENGDFDAFLTKPVSIQTLVDTVKNLIAAPLNAMASG